MKNKMSMKRYLPKPSRREIFTIILLFVEIIIFSVISPNFLTPNNLETVLRNSTDLAVVSIGMTIVMILGGIDISVGSAMGVVAIVVGWLLEAGIFPLLIVLVAILAGTTIGFLNGILVTKAKIPAIITTLGTSSILRALIFGMLGGMRGWLTGLQPVFSVFTRGHLLGIPIPVFLLGIIYLLFWYIMTNTSVGRHIYAVGNSEEAAKLAGISTDRIVLLSFSILGALVGFTALIYVGRLASVEITVGQDLPLSAIAATVIGGTSVKGGKGSVVGTLAGVLFIAIMKNGVVLLGIPSLWEKAVVGFLIIISVIIDLLINKRIERRKREELSAQKKESLA